MKNDTNTKNKKELADRIRRTRTHVANATQKEFADSLGISRVYVAQLENPDSPKLPSNALLRRISDLYQIDYEYLVSGSQNPVSIDFEEELILEQIQRNSDFEQNEHTADASLPVFARTYHKLFSDELLKLTSPKDMKPKDYEHYCEIFHLFYQPLLETLISMKEAFQQQKKIPEDLYENYLKAIQKQINLLTNQEETTHEE